MVAPALPALLRQVRVEVIWRIAGRGFGRDIQLTRERG
jgi:hypothetical protein